MDSVRLYLKFLGIALRSRMQYRSDFVVGIVSVILNNTVNLTLTWVLIARFQTLQGWQYWEIVMLFGTWLLSHSVYASFFWHLTTMEDDVRYGRFDQYLMRPCSPLLQFLGREVNYMGLADALFGVLVVMFAHRTLNVHWGTAQWLFWSVVVLSGTVIETSIALVIGAISFWTGRSQAVYTVVLRFQSLTANYPLDIFGPWFRVLMTGLLPVAFINYYPLTILLGKENALGVSWLGYLSPLVAGLTAGLAGVVWRRGLARYASSGN